MADVEIDKIDYDVPIGWADENGDAEVGFVRMAAGVVGLQGGNLLLASYVDCSEIATPTAPAANRGRLFVRDNGSGKTQLCVRFATGAVQVIATEP